MSEEQPISTISREERDRAVRPFVVRMALFLVFLAALPTLFALAVQPDGALYLGTPFNTDDHMVYAAWMHQAKQGAFFFDNRFAVDEQAGLTVHLYFWLLGQISRVFGEITATTIARLAFTGLFVWTLWQLLRRTTLDGFTTKLAMVLTVGLGGIGFLVWHNFGRAFVRPGTGQFAPLFGGHLPVDVWQPEVLIFPSMLTNGLFMVSLCLMLAVLICVLDARKSWRPVLPGAAAFGVLMNIHSYDVVILGLAMLGLALASLKVKQFSVAWLLRCLTIVAGAIPAAVWFLHVLSVDPVFQSRAATPTYTSGVPTLLGGILFAWLLAVVAASRFFEEGQRQVGIAAAWVAWMAPLLVTGFQTQNAYALTPIEFGILAVGGFGLVWLSARPDPAWNLLLSWAVLGFLAPYLPALFQRKLAAGLAIPFAILAAIGLSQALQRFDRSQRQVAMCICVLLMCATPLLWLRRELELIRDNVSTTTVQPAFLSPEVMRMIQIVAKDEDDRKVIVAIPGIPSQGAPDQFSVPVVPDLNPVFSGLAGAYSYAGHWSETPNYGERRSASMERLFLDRVSDEQRLQFLKENQVDFVISINVENYPDSPFADLRSIGTVLASGNQFVLIRVR